MAVLLLLNPAPTPAGGFLKEIGRFVGKVLKVALTGSGPTRAAAGGAPALEVPRGRLLYAHPPRGTPEPGTSLACLDAPPGFLLLEMPNREVVWVPVPPRDERRAPLVVLRLPPGEYAWVGFEVQRVTDRTYKDSKGRPTRTVVTVRVWREQGAFRLPFVVPDTEPRYVGTVELTDLVLRGSRSVVGHQVVMMRPGMAQVRARLLDDGPLARREAAARFGPRLPNSSFEPLAFAQDRREEAEAWEDFEELARYRKFLRDLDAVAPAGWPPLESGRGAPRFRLGLHRVYHEYLEREGIRGRLRGPRRQRRLVRWLEVEGREVAGILLDARVRRSRIRALTGRLREAARRRREARAMSREARPGEGAASTAPRTGDGSAAGAGESGAPAGAWGIRAPDAAGP